MSIKVTELEKTLLEVIGEVAAERGRQDVKYGMEHDDKHVIDDFLDYIQQRCIYNDLHPETRKRLIEIAALAIAAVQSIDRRQAAESAH